MRLYILILLLLFSFSLSGQHMMLAGGSQDAPPAGDLLLDDYPGAAAAYSLRELSSALAGQDVIRVRESGSNTEQDFTAAEITDGTLATFCGANDGFVVTWYDQSGNGNHAVQVTNTNQPQIVDNGVLVQENSNAAMTFNGTDNHFNLPVLTSSSDFTCLIVTGSLLYQTSSKNARFFDLITSNASLQLLMDDPTHALHMKNSLWQTGFIATRFDGGSATQNLMTTVFESSQNLLFLNGLILNISATPPNIVGASGTVGKIGARADLEGTTNFNGKYQEMIIYPSNQSANRAGIESNINNYYNIY